MPSVKVLFLTSFIIMVIGVLLRIVGFFKGEEQLAYNVFTGFNGFKIFNCFETFHFIKATGFTLTSTGLILNTVAAYMLILSIASFGLKVYVAELR